VFRALDAEPAALWINRTLAVSYAQIGERDLARRAVQALGRYRPGIAVTDVASAMRQFPPGLVSRISNGLSDLGLPP
jgi:hypothetical protein